MVNNEQNKALTISFKIPITLNQKMNEKIIVDGYGMRGKSRWVKEAIEALLTYSDFPELVSFSDAIENTNYANSIRIPRQLLLNIENAVIAVRKEYPDLEGVKSRIIRTAILQRLIR